MGREESTGYEAGRDGNENAEVDVWSNGDGQNEK